MGKNFYFKSLEHLQNFCLKNGKFGEKVLSVILQLGEEAIKENEIARDIMSKFTYLLKFEQEKNYSKLMDICHLAKDFLEKKGDLKSLVKKYNIFEDDFSKGVIAFFEYEDYSITNEFIETLEKLEYLIGLYFLYNENKELIYIGKSKNLGSRILTSTKERKAFYLKYKETYTKSDTNILELYYIAKYKPSLNSDSKENDDTTLNLNYSFKQESDFIKIRGED
ncbi:hypothetical protein [Fusobacterium ulcerans]|uniref:hypothetical protein n=1 Tax=Fusobacterium ulcerans TaxID=861 RepID=UPI0030A38C06